MKGRKQTEEWKKTRAEIIKVAGKIGSDAYVGRLFGITKAAVQSIRSRNNIPAYGGSRSGPKAKGDKKIKEALARGYPNVTVAALWEENRKIQDLLDGWGR